MTAPAHLALYVALLAWLATSLHTVITLELAIKPNTPGGNQ